MQAIEFNSKTYIVQPGVGAPSGAINVADLASKDLVTLYNLAVSPVGGRRVNKFADRPTGIKRTCTALVDLVELDEAEAELPPKKSAPKKQPVVTPVAVPDRKPRGMRFVFPYHGDDNLRKIQSKDSLRGRAAALLQKGAHFTDIVKLVRQFDKDRGHGPGFEERRAYEVVRLLHYYVGFGLRQDKSGKIFTHKTPVGQR